MSLVPVDASVVSHERVTLEQSLSLWEDTAKLAHHLAATEFVPKDLRNKPAAVCAAMLRANELGISPMQGLSQIFVINGRPGLASELMRALVLSKGHSIWTETFNNTHVTVCGQRLGDDHVEKVTWTLDDAKRAGLAGRDVWRAYPRAMLLARATSELCRLKFPDVIAGMSYSIEELTDLDDEDALMPGEAPAELEPGAPAMQTRKVAGTAKKATPRRRARQAAPVGELSAGPPAPPLPGEPGGEPLTSDASGSSTIQEGAETGNEPDEVVTKRAQMIAMKANDAGVDHHLVIAAVTNGEKSSAKAVTPDEGTQVFEALYKIRQRELWLDTSGEVPRLVTEQPADSGEAPALDLGEAAAGTTDTANDREPDAASPGPEPFEMTVDDWRAYLTERGVKVTKLLAEAQRLAALDGEPVPASLDDITGRDSLCELLFNYVQDLADKAAGS